MGVTPATSAGLSEILWERSFRYRRGSILVTRSRSGWQIADEDRRASGETLVAAFEALRGKRARDLELAVVVAALAWDERAAAPGDGPAGVAAEVWEVPCTCGRSGCRELVELSAAEYRALREAGEDVLAPGHTVSRSAKARARSPALVEEATALGEQARQQVARADRNRRSR